MSGIRARYDAGSRIPLTGYGSVRLRVLCAGAVLYLGVGVCKRHTIQSGSHCVDTLGLLLSCR